MTTKSQRLRWSDIRAASRMIGELYDSGQSLQQRFSRLMDGVNALIGSDVAFYCTMADYLPGRVMRPLAPVFGARTEPAMVQYMAQRRQLASMEGDVMVDLTLARPEPLVTANIRRLLPAREYLRRYPQQAEAFPSGASGDIGVTYFRHANGRDISGFAMHRLEGRAYSHREMKLLEFITGELQHLYQSRGLIYPLARPALPLRQQQVVDGLLAGKGVKRIALEMAIAPDTVREYLQVICRKYRVQGRDELLVRLLTDQRADKGC